MVDSVVKGVLTGLQDRISSLGKTYGDLVNKNVILKTRITSLEAQCDLTPKLQNFFHAHNYKIIEEYSIFQAQISLECYFSCS